MEEKSYWNILIYDISYKTLIGAKPLYVRFGNVNGYIRVYDGTKYLVLFAVEKPGLICNRIRYHVFCHNYTRIIVNSYDSFPLEQHWHFIML